MAALLATGLVASAAFGGGLKKDSLPSGFHPYLDGYVENLRIDTNSMALINTVRACSVFVDVKKRMPEIAGRLEKMAKEKDVDGLMQAYEAIDRQIYDICWQTRLRNEITYVDVAAMLAMQLDSASSKKEALAWVFLALPRLLDRAHSPSLPQIDSSWVAYLAKDGKDAETDFLGRTSGRLPGMGDALRKYWYKADCRIPTSEEMRAFFTYFCAAF
jgi:hypothetical protein